ncbi:Putative vacuolar membrane transporter for cationic amino acids [Rhodosporidiobolus nylandii]
MALTTEMVFSSLFGYVTLGFSVAAFIPLIMTNAVQRRSGTSPIFLYVWIVADILNVVGIILLGAQLTQIFLAVWYCLADTCLFIQLMWFGHRDPLAPHIKPSTNLLAKLDRKNHPRWLRFCEQFYSYSVWDDVSLAIGCIAGGMAWWGIWTVIQLQKNPDYEVEHKTEISTLAWALGMAASLTFATARLPEVLSGVKRDTAEEEPIHEVDDPLWWFLIAENCFNLASIVTLSRDPDYLWHAELPWMLGSLLPIAGDALVLVLASRWQSHWKKSDKRTQREKETRYRKDKLDELDAERLRLEEKWQIKDRLEDLKLTDTFPNVEDEGWLERRKAKAVDKANAAARADATRHESRLRDELAARTKPDGKLPLPSSCRRPLTHVSADPQRPHDLSDGEASSNFGLQETRPLSRHAVHSHGALHGLDGSQMQRRASTAGRSLRNA